MQQQASAWLSAAFQKVKSKRTSLHRFLTIIIVAPIFTSVSAPLPAQAATYQASDTYCTQTISGSTDVTVIHTGNSCAVIFKATAGNASTSYTWTVPTNLTSVSILVVGGGGSGGRRHGGGGGAGGYIYATGVAVTPSGNVSITVGKGGDAVAGDSSGTGQNGNAGANSTYAGYTAYGGGLGGQTSSGGSGSTVGSAGGSCCASAAGTSSSGQGNNGGKGTRGNSEVNWSGGGGGGAGGVGGNSTSDQSIGGADGYTTAGNATGGAGGAGLSNSITGSAVCYAAGGGGSGGNGNVSSGAGGAGGACGGVTSGGTGGKGPNSTSPNYLATQGVDGTGSGGGGGGFQGSTDAATGRGGSGIVVIRYDLPVVTIDVNGGSGYTGATSLNISASGSVTLPTVSSMVRSGYTFAGWNTAANGSGTNYAAGASYTPSANITLYAQWNSTISYNTNGATTTQSVLPTTSKSSGATTTLSNGLGTGTPIATGLVLNLDASDPSSISGTTWTNKSSSGLSSATIVGSPKYDSTDGSFQLNGVDQYFSLGNTDYAYVGTTPFSINLSFNPTDPNTTSCLFARYNGNVAGSYQLKVVSNSALGIYREVSPWGVSSSALLQAGNIYYASMTYDGTNLRGYLNGNLVLGPTALGSVYSSNIATQIGGCQYNTALNQAFKGKVYNAQVYNRALSASEVQTNFQNLLGGQKIGKTNYTLGPWTTAADTGTAYGNPMQFDISALPTPYFRLNADSYISNTTPLVASVGASNLSISAQGTFSVKASGGGSNGANARFATIGGTTTAGIRLGNPEVKNYTLCTLARYAPKSDGSTGAKGRLIANHSTVGNSNWFSGWYYGATRQFHHGAWVLMPTDVDDDWHLSCDSGNTIYWDGVLQSSGVTPQAYTGLPQLAINWDYNAQNSDWEFAEMIVYDSVLSPSQMNQISRYFSNRYGLVNVNSSSVSAAAPSNVTNYSSGGNATLYASWQSTITYDANDATYGTAPASQTIWNTPGTVSGNTGSLSKNGYIFNGWNTAANGSGTRYAVGAPLINDGNKVLYAQWVLPVNFPIAKINPSTLAPYQRFVASDYDPTNKIWKDSSGNGRNAGRVAGTPSVITTTANTYGAANSFKVLSGDTSAKVWFGNAPITPNWTVFALSRYSGASKARIVSGDVDRSNSNILIGHWAGGAGIAHMNGWIGGSSTPAGVTVTNWIMSTVFPYNYRLNGTSMGSSGGTNVLSALGINTYSTEVSNFEVAEVIIFDRTLSSSEIIQVEDYFDETYGLSYPKVGSYKTTNSLTVANSIGGRSDTYTATDGFGNKSFTVSPTIPGITLDQGTTNGVAVVVAPTVAVGTYYETITATDVAGNTSQFPYQITVVNPLIWSASNPSAVITTYGKPTRTRLDLSGGFGTRLASLSHSSTPNPRGVTIDTSTVAIGYITLITDTGTAPGTYSESITVTDGSNIRRTLLLTITVNSPPDISYSSATDAPYPYRTSNLVLNVDPSNLSSYSGSGQTIKDISSTNKTFTFYNASAVATNGVFTEVAGGAISQDGTNLYAQTTSLPSMDTYTVEAWINLKATNGVNEWRSIVTDMYTTSGDRINFHLGTCGNASNEICGSFFDGAAWNARAAYTVNLNTWYHITYVIAGSTGNHIGYMYANGVLVSTSASTTSNPSTSNRGLRIGRRWDIAQIFNGLIGSVRIYNTALTSTQVAQDYSNTKPRFLSLSTAAPTISGNAILTTTEGKATTYQVFAETGGTGASTFALSGANNTFSLGAIAADQTSVIVGSATTATNSTTAKTYYETLTATDSASATTAYYLTINVNPKISIAATTDTVTTTFGKFAYDTITASYGTGNLSFTRTSSSGSSAITSSISGNQAVLTIASTLPVGTYFETFTVTDSVSATSFKVIQINVNAPPTIVSDTGISSVTTTYTRAASLRLNVSGGTGTKSYSIAYTGGSGNWKITLDTSTAASNYITLKVDSYTATGTLTATVTATDAAGGTGSLAVQITINDFPRIENILTPHSIFTSGLVFHLDGANTNSAKSASSWVDLAGNKSSTTASSAPTVSTDGEGSYSFNGSANFLTVPGITAAGNPGLTNGAFPTFTEEVWVKFNSLAVTAGQVWCVFCEAFTPASTTDKMNMAIYLSGTSGAVSAGYVSLVSGASSWRNTITSSTNVAASSWNHFAYTVSYDGSLYQARLYLNGALVGSSSDSYAPTSSNRDYYIGRRWDGAQYLNGLVGAVRVYNQALTLDQVQQNYNAGAVRYGRATAASKTIITTQGATTSSPALTASLGTGTKTLSVSPTISGITSDVSSTANVAILTSTSNLAATDTQTARTYTETLTAVDAAGASTSYKAVFLVNPPIIETATYTSLSTTSGIETSTVIYATKGSSDKTFTLTGTAASGVTLTSGTNQATLRVLSTINPGTYYETVTATDTASATTSIMITIYVAPPPSITGQTRIESTKGVVAKSSLYAISGGTGTLTMSVSNSPANANITLTGVTSSGGYLQIGSSSETGTFTSTIRVTDARGSYSEIPVTVVVNAPVTLSGSLSITKTYGTSTTSGYSTNGSGTGPFSFSASPVCAVVRTVTGNITLDKINGTDSCTWTAPVGVTAVDALLVGAGGGGGGDGGSGGGGGSINTLTSVSLPANRQLAVQVGAGGTGGLWGGSAATSGGTTSLTSGSTTYTAPGGAGGGGCGSAASAGGVTGSGGSPVAGGAGGYGGTGTGCGAGTGNIGSAGPSSSFTGTAVNYGGGGGGGPFPDAITSVGGKTGGAGGGGTGTTAKGFGSYGLPTYFRALVSTPNAASNQDAFTTGLCGSATGNINYSTDSDFPCSQTDNFQGYATGYFVSPYTGSITFCLYSDDSSYLNINGQTLSKTGASTLWQCSSALTGFTQGQAYPISVYFTEMGGLASWKLAYTYGGVGSTSSPVIIPNSQYRSGSEGLALYFQTSATTPALASTKPVLSASSSGCLERIGIINFSSDNDFPCSQKDNFQGYATGYFVSPYTGDITFYLSSDDTSALEVTVNGTTSELLKPTCCGESSITISGFVQGQYYPINSYFTEVAGVAQWTLAFSYGSQSKIIIPSTYLRTLKDFTEPTAGTNGLGGGGGAGSAGLYKITGARGGSGTAIIRYLTQSDTATETMITAVVNQESPSGLLTLNVPAYVQVGTYTETITVRDSVNSAPYSATVTITVNKATPSATLSLPGGVTTAQYGTPVTLSVAASTPGRVAFKKSGTAISGCESVTATSGVASCTWTPTAVESTTISALLTPTDTINYNNSVETATASRLTIQVGKADTLTITANTPSAITYSASMTMPTNGFTTSGLKSIDSITAMSYSYATGSGSTCATGGVCSVGDIGPAGGYVFYVSSSIIDSATGISTGGRYLEAAPASLFTPTTMRWCESSSNPYSTSFGGTSRNIGSGAENSRIINANCTGGAGYTATNATIAGLSDWFLPSEAELNEMMSRYSQIGITDTNYFFSSSEFDVTRAYAQRITFVSGGVSPKSNQFLYWPIRAFGGSSILSGPPTDAGTYYILPSSATFIPGLASNYSSIQYQAGTLVINKAPRGTWSATYASGSNLIRYGVGKTETATVTYPGDGVKSFSTTSSVCSVDASSGTLTTLGVGTCSIQVVLSQTTNWLSDTKTVTVTIDRGLRTATITPALSTIKYGDTTTVTSTISPALDSATVTYSANGTLGCLVDNVTGLVTGIKALTACSVGVTYDRTDLYESATATASITVNRANAPVITTDSITAVSYTGATAIVTPTYTVTGILARDISQILPTADVSSASAIAAIAASSYSQVASFRYFATTPTNYDSTTAPTLGGTYSVTAQGLTLGGGLDIGNYETPTAVASNLVINPIAQTPLVIKLSYLESVTVPYDVVTTGGSSTGARTLTVLAGGTATGCAVDVATSAMRLKSSSAGTCIIQVTQAADRNYLIATSESQTVNILNFVVNILQLFSNPTGISINSYVPFTKGPDVCTSNCRPTITQITDMNGTTITSLAANTPFRIIGTNFNTTTSVQFSAMIGTEDIFGEDADSFQIDSDTQLTVMPPAILVPAPGQSSTATTVLIHVRASGGLSSPNMTITLVTL